MSSAPQAFQVPNYLNADQPIEHLGKKRDDVRLMVLDRTTGNTVHGEFLDLLHFLEPGDVLVLNNSRTIPAVLKGTQSNRDVEIRLSRQINENHWEALIVGGLFSSLECISLPNGIKAKVAGSGNEKPLVKLHFSIKGQELFDFIYEYGEPIRYEYIKEPWTLDSYQTVYASIPGSVEMASAGRAFSWKLLNLLKEKGIELAFLQLHAGLSYYGNDQWPNPSQHPEPYHVPVNVANKINKAKQNGKRIIAVGTTVVRALETVADESGNINPGSGVTTLYINEDTRVKTVDGLLTGLHEPEASHLDLLSAFIEKKLLFKAYHLAIEKGYLWHEFGDMNLILPMRNPL
ncbi:S-adenosylmethionine:tRNA ribosyltransferase-isomerase [Bacillus sp. AK128]